MVRAVSLTSPDRPINTGSPSRDRQAVLHNVIYLCACSDYHKVEHTLQPLCNRLISLVIILSKSLKIFIMKFKINNS